MASFKDVKQGEKSFRPNVSNRRGPSGSSGGISNADLPDSGGGAPRRDREGAFFNKRTQEPRGSKGTVEATFRGNGWNKINTRVSEKHSAGGVPAQDSPHARAGRDAMYHDAESSGPTKAPFDSDKVNVKVAATGSFSHARGGAKGPERFTQPDKVRTAGRRGTPAEGMTVGYSGSSQGRKAVGHTGQNLGKKSKRAALR